MNQIVLNGVALPKVSKDKYACWEEMLSQQVDMVTGRRVIEQRGKVWKVSYEYDYMGNETMRQVMAQLRAGTPIVAAVLPDNSDQMVTSVFVVESIGQPTFAFSRNGVGLWHNLSFVLREERPHD